MDKHLHILSFDIPYPADYGGVIDVFYKIKALQAAGVNVHLHCFEYGRARQTELNKFCASVQYYRRKTGFRGLAWNLPYIVSSRANSLLFENLLRDEHPILLEGVHCSYLLRDKRFESRKILLRLHNVEYLYYRGLQRATGSIFQKLYYWSESRLLLRYERSIARRTTIAALSESDAVVYREKFNADRISYLPVFLPYSTVTSREGTGNYCLYHGNLAVPENERIVTWLAKHVFYDESTPFVVAGKNPSARLKKNLEKNQNCCLIADPSDEDMQDLVSKAHINILPSLNDTGVKLKLLNALFNGRHCISNENAVTSTILRDVCHIADNPQAMRNLVASLRNQPFTQEDADRRKLALERHYNNSAIAEKLIRWIL